MIKNYYYFIVGILSILSSFSLVWRGQSSFMPLTNASNIDIASKTTIVHIWQIITAENLIFGVALIVMSVYKDVKEVKFTAWVIAIIMFARLAVIIASTLFKNENGVADTLTESLVLLVFVGLIILGVKKK